MVTVDPVMSHVTLAFQRNQVVDEPLTERCADRRMLRWIQEDHAVMVEQALIALHLDAQRAFVTQLIQVPRSLSTYALLAEAKYRMPLRLQLTRSTEKCVFTRSPAMACCRFV